MSDQDWLMGAGILAAGNLILFLVLNLIDFDINKSFSLPYLNTFYSITSIFLISLVIIVTVLMLVVFAFFKRRITSDQTKMMAASFIIISAIAGIFFFKNFIFSYIIFAAWSATFGWIALTPKKSVQKYEDKKEVMKDVVTKFTITLTIGLVLSGLIFGIMDVEQHKQAITSSVSEITMGVLSLGEVMEELVCETLLPEDLYIRYAKGLISEDLMKTSIENNAKGTNFYKTLTPYQKQEFLSEVMTQIEDAKAAEGKDGYPTLKKGFEKWKLDMIREIELAVSGAGLQIFEMFPILGNMYVIGGLLAFSLLATFNLVNGLVIRTLCVHAFFWMIQKDETIIKPEEPKDIVYSERRPKK